MKEIIASRIEKLKKEIEQFFEKDDVGLDEAEVYFTQRIGETVRGLLTVCYEQKDAKLLADKAGRKALNEGDRDFFCSVRDSLLAQWPEREKTILENSNYLLDHFKAIHIDNTDPEARKGGATGPHVSHVLSSRLSSRPMGWSPKTLKKFVPILAAGQCTFHQEQTSIETAPKTERLRKKAAVAKVIENPLGLPHPDMVASIPARSGKITPLYRLLNSLTK